MFWVMKPVMGLFSYRDIEVDERSNFPAFVGGSINISDDLWLGERKCLKFMVLDKSGGKKVVCCPSIY